MSLLEAYKPRDGNKEPIVEVGDIVIMRNEHEKRSFWKLAEIVELYKGEDQSIRAAKIQVAGEGKKVLNRSLKHLIPLEIRSQHAKINANSDPTHNDMPTQQPQASKPQQQQSERTHKRTQNQHNCNRPRRNAALIGELARRDNMK